MFATYYYAFSNQIERVQIFNSTLTNNLPSTREMENELLINFKPIDTPLIGFHYNIATDVNKICCKTHKKGDIIIINVLPKFPN